MGFIRESLLLYNSVTYCCDMTTTNYCVKHTLTQVLEYITIIRESSIGMGI